MTQGIPITSPSFWHDEEESTEEIYRKVFRSATEEPMPLFDKRVIVLQEAAEVLCKVRFILNPIYWSTSMTDGAEFRR
jgi:hypothetical protein